jgi:esterase/lipase superfamily enzyme
MSSLPSVHVVLLTLLLCLLPYGDVEAAAIVEGFVRDESGQAVANVRVVCEQQGRILSESQTDANGRFSLERPLGPGVYRLYVRTDRYIGDHTFQIGPVLGEARYKVDASFQVFRGSAAKPPPPPAVAAPAPARPRPDGPPPVARNGGSQENFAVVRVFYATDRQLGASQPVTFSAARAPSGELTLGTFDVSIPREHRLGNVERPSIWRLEFRQDRDKHFVIVERTVKDVSTFYGELARRVERTADKEAIVFIHGYNVGFDDAIYRTAQLSYDLGFGGAPILYSWPSNGRTLDYNPDVNNSDWSIVHLESFLRQLVARAQAKSIYLVAHSMGNRVLAGALARLGTDTSLAVPQFTHVVLTAPDIDAGVFRQLATAIVRTAHRTTLYASSNDKALQLSKRMNGYARAGDAGVDVVVVSGVDTIDASDVDTDLIGHSYYGDNRSVLSDMFNLLRGHLPPRFGLKEATSGAQRYWRFAP